MEFSVILLPDSGKTVSDGKFPPAVAGGGGVHGEALTSTGGVRASALDDSLRFALKGDRSPTGGDGSASAFLAADDVERRVVAADVSAFAVHEGAVSKPCQPLFIFQAARFRICG
jgi:hypothetical protein